MSFFYDFFDDFNVKDLSDKTEINIVLGVGVAVVGNVKIKDFSESMLEIVCGKKVLKFVGEGLKMSSISKGEIVISGKIFSFETGEKWVKN